MHVLQVDDIVGVVVAILGLVTMAVVVVAVVVDFVAGNGAYRFAGLFALGRAKCPMSNFLCLLLLLDLSLALGVLFSELDGIRVK